MVSAAVYLRLSDEDRNKNPRRTKARAFRIRNHCLPITAVSETGIFLIFIVTRITAERIFTDLIFSENACRL